MPFRALITSHEMVDGHSKYNTGENKGTEANLISLRRCSSGSSWCQSVKYATIGILVIYTYVYV